MKGRDAKPHIGIFGRRNNGKSSLINCLADQDVAIVSEEPGTTTDPVKKSMEIPGIGPVVLIDTAGTDDSGELGKKRVAKSREVFRQIDLGILVLAENLFNEEEEAIIGMFDKWEVPYLVIHNKSDLAPLLPQLKDRLKEIYEQDVLDFSTLDALHRDELITKISESIPESAYLSKSLVGDIISQGDLVLLITPIDDEAPEGRMILPQVQVIRDVLDHDGIAIVCKEREVDALLRRLEPRPALVITDSQVFPKADAAMPKDIPLTSFSIVLARQKGDFANYLKGTPKISGLKDGTGC